MVTNTTLSIGYASYQQQSTNSPGSTSNDLISIILFFSIIILLVISFIVYFWFTEWHKVSSQQRSEDELERQKEIDQLVENLKEQMKAVFKLPLIGLLIVIWKGTFFISLSSSHNSTMNHKNQFHPHSNDHTIPSKKRNIPIHHTLPPQLQQNKNVPPILSTYITTPQYRDHYQQQPCHFISREHQKVWFHRFHHSFSILCLLGILVSLILLLITITNITITDDTSVTLQAGLFVFVLCINLFLITRQHYYYCKRRFFWGNSDAHMNAIYKTHFPRWDTSMWSNWIQLLILIIEFFQLLTFPLRDLMTINTFDDDSSVNSQFHRFLSIFLNVGGIMLDGMRTPVWYTYTVWAAFGITMLSLVIACLVHGINYWKPYRFPNRWVRWCIPVVTLLYIPLLTTFVSSAACQSLNVNTNDFAPTLRCHAPNISQQLYLWLSLLGYAFAYFLMTIFLTSYERIPKQNEIAFKSISVAFIKNMGLLLAIVFLLVESTTKQNRMRAILSIIILLTMICYNIKAKPCYVDIVNFFRTASFCCILWTSILVAILSESNTVQSLGSLTVFCIIIGGWGFIIVLFTLIYCIYNQKQESLQPDNENEIHV
ncbi:hypothetical protein BJ944DRAFT_194156 [Cunninghamella echinulata]|nr:hypothetical protein BJ944DRAFT_194156 [Cunninghamella echinulata]